MALENERDFFEKMQEFLPSTQEEYCKSVKEYGEVLETLIILDIAKQYMGPKTALLQKEADRDLGRL